MSTSGSRSTGWEPFSVYFSIFVQKSWKNAKSKKFGSNLAQKCFFLSLHQNAGQVFYSQI